MTHLRVFGSIAFVHIPEPERRKLDPKSLRCVFVGYCETKKAYRFWDPVGHSIKISRDAKFYEQHRLMDVPVESFLNLEKPNNNDLVQSTAEDLSGLTQPNSTVNPAPDTVDPDQKKSPRRILRGRIPRREWTALLTTNQHEDPDEPYEPDQYRDAICCPDANKWKASMVDEYESLMKNDTWNLTSLPQGRRAIKGRWTFKYKPAANGEDPRYKARFVACGYSQRPGTDYNETYAAVVSHDTFRILMSTVVALDLEMVQLDVKTAFLYGDLEEEIYLEQPEGFVVVGHETEVCRLKRSIYGLKQASHIWSARFSGFLHQQEFKQSDADLVSSFVNKKTRPLS